MSRPFALRGALALGLALAGAMPAAAADDKEDAKTHFARIEQALNEWDIATAKKELAEVEELVPSNIEPLSYFKGRVAFEEGRYAEAVELLTDAGVQDKPGSYLRLAKDTLKVTKGHASKESAHFIFFYPPGKDEVLAPYALETLESIRDALGKDLGHVPEGKIRVEVVNDARELAKVSTLTYEQIRTTGTIAICKFNKLMVTSPKAVLRGYEWQDTLAHEFTHLVVTQKGRNKVPIWLHEGLAKYLESRWRGPPGLAMSPSSLALLGSRVKTDKLVPFEKMHPSMALLPTAEDAATAFGEVFYAIDYVFKGRGTEGLRTIIDELAAGRDDKKAVEAATGQSFAGFERSWLEHIKQQRFPTELLPTDKIVLKDESPGEAKKKDEQEKGKEISFGDFDEVDEVEARKFAHLGELMRERNRAGAAADEFGRAHQVVGDKYESISNKYALALLEIRRTEDAEKVLLGSLRVHPGSPATHVHLGRIYLARKDLEKAKGAYLEALASDPFDEEIHFALLRIHLGQGTKDLAERARRAAQVLTGLRGEEVEQVARNLVREGQDLAQVALPAKPEPPGAKPEPSKGAAKPAEQPKAPKPPEKTAPQPPR